MILISVLSLTVHLLILAKAVQFFLGYGRACRDQDKHMVAAISMLSMVFVVAYVMSVFRDNALTAITDIPLLVAHNLAVSVILLGHIQSVAGRKCEVPTQ